MMRIFCYAASLTGVASVAVTLSGYLFAPAVAAQSLDPNTQVPAGVVCPAAMLQPDIQALGHTQISILRNYWETTSPLEIIQYGNIVSVVPLNLDDSGVEILPLRPDQHAFVTPLAIAGQLFNKMQKAAASDNDIRYKYLGKFLVYPNLINGRPGDNHGTFFACFPELKELFFFANQRLSPQSLNAAQVAEAQRQQADAAGTAKPEHVLLRSYAEYIYVKKCYDGREGYLSINVSDQELDKARTAVRSIEQKMIQTDPNLDKDALWKRANSEDGDWQTDRDKNFQAEQNERFADFRNRLLRFFSKGFLHPFRRL